MDPYRQQLAGAIQAVKILSATRYAWFGVNSPALARGVGGALTPASARVYLLFTLQQQLYEDFYCRGAATPARPALGGDVPRAAGPFAQALAQANTGTGSWQAGWEVCAVEDGERGAVRVCRGGLELRACPADCQVPANGRLAPGVLVRLRLPKDMPGSSPGFYLALGDEPFAIARGGTVVRLYWHLTAAGAGSFVAHATHALNAARLPFRLKVVNDPARFDRCDGAVLHLRGSDFPAAVGPLRGVYAAVAATLRPGIPALSKPLAPGLGLAEDPGGGESFGQHRCALLADGLIRAHEQGRKSVEERLRAVEERFAAEGIGLDAPYLNRGSRDTYEFHLHPAGHAHEATPLPVESVAGEGPAGRTPAVRGRQRPPGSGMRSAGQREEIDGARHLGAAATIGERLVREAVWWDGRCTWLGADVEPAADRRHGPRAVYRSLGPELYGGTGGVALFLAELSRATGDVAVRRAAIGAARQALARADELEHRLGLYTGQVGVALAAARVGTTLGEGGLLRGAGELLRCALDDGCDEPGFDIIAGRAGAIVALLALRTLLADSSLVEEAARLGDALIRDAHVSERGYSWSVPGVPALRDLTGLGHGAAGAALALLELFAATGTATYRAAAERAFAYERSWFDDERENWPDFRLRPGERARRGAPPRFAVAWCHGAAGIALTRLRAYALLDDDTYRAEALAALRTTRTQVEAELHAGDGNYSLCHGLAGNAGVLLYGAQVLGKDAFDGRELACAVADAGIAAYASGAEPWPCGTPSGETPGLMLGLAGIGSFDLRLHDPALPSILLPFMEPHKWMSHAATGGEMN